MGILNLDDSIDEAFEEAEVGSGRLADGKYDGVVKGVKIEPSKTPWIDMQLSVQLEAQQGGTTFANIELSPLTDKEGNISRGKLKFLKWQLQSLGYTGKLSDLEYNLEGLFGAGVTFEVKTTEGRTNPKTGKPYMNREVVMLDNIHPGLAGISAAPMNQEEVAY